MTLNASYKYEKVEFWLARTGRNIPYLLQQGSPRMMQISYHNLETVKRVLNA